jgi:hypothetical protein
VLSGFDVIVLPAICAMRSSRPVLKPGEGDFNFLLGQRLFLT